MKKFFLLLLTAVISVTASAQAQINTKKIKIADFTQKVTKVVLTGNTFYDGAFQEEVSSRWRVSPYEFCTLQEFETLKKSDKYYFLMLTQGRFKKEEEPGIQFLTLVKGGEKAAEGIGKDGYYTIAKIVENDDGVVFTFVNQDGETEVTVRHGDTPVKGEDYWTEEDKQEMFDYINTWAPTPASATLLATGWVDNEQTIEVPGVTSKSIVLVSYDPTDENYETYIAEDVKCVAQGFNSLTFRCSYIPDVDVKVNIAVFYSSEVVAGGSGGISSVYDDGNGNVYIE